MRLTDKQEKFCQLLVDIGSKSEAYRQAYDATNMTPKTINEESCRLSMRPNIAARIEEIRDELAIRDMWRRVNSVEALTRIVNKQDDAMDKDIVAAVKTLNSMYGWDKQTIDLQSSDGSMSQKPTVIQLVAPDANSKY